MNEPRRPVARRQGDNVPPTDIHLIAAARERKRHLVRFLRVFVCHVVSRGDAGAAYTGVTMATAAHAVWWERETKERLRRKTPGRLNATARR